MSTNAPGVAMKWEKSYHESNSTKNFETKYSNPQIIRALWIHVDSNIRNLHPSDPDLPQSRTNHIPWEWAEDQGSPFMTSTQDWFKVPAQCRPRWRDRIPSQHTGGLCCSKMIAYTSRFSAKLLMLDILVKDMWHTSVARKVIMYPCQKKPTPNKIIARL
jgi:hypothetical protein